MHPPAIVEDPPKSIRVDHAKVGDNRNQHIFDALLVKCARQVMMIYNIKAITGSQDNWNHVFAEKLRSFLVLLRAPAFPLSLDLAHAYGNLGWAQVGDTYRLKNGFADRHHWMLLYMQSLVYSWGLMARPLAGRITRSLSPFKEFGLVANRPQPEPFARFPHYSARGARRHRSGFVGWPFSPMRRRLIN